MALCLLPFVNWNKPRIRDFHYNLVDSKSICWLQPFSIYACMSRRDQITTHISHSIWLGETPPWRRWPNLWQCKHNRQHPRHVAPPRYANGSQFDRHACHTQSDVLQSDTQNSLMEYGMVQNGMQIYIQDPYHYAATRNVIRWRDPWMPGIQSQRIRFPQPTDFGAVAGSVTSWRKPKLQVQQINYKVLVGIILYIILSNDFVRVYYNFA